MERLILDAAKVQTLFDTKQKNVYELASVFGRSVTYARSVLNGYLPVREPEQIVQRLADFLEVEPRQLLQKKKTA